MNAAEFYWAIVGDASPEPVAVVEENGKRVAYTCGCPDPFDLDGPHARIVLIFEDDHSNVPHRAGSDPEPEPLRVPMRPRDARAAATRRERLIQKDRAAGIIHRHRRFNP